MSVRQTSKVAAFSEGDVDWGGTQRAKGVVALVVLEEAAGGF